MSLLKPAVQVIELTPEQIKTAKLRAVKREILKLTAQVFAQIETAQNRGIDLVWNNTDGLTPTEVLSELGTDAGKLFDLHGAMTELLVFAAAEDGIAPSIKLPTAAFTRHDDGTITIDE